MSKEKRYNYKQIDPLLHSPIRLSVMSLLTGCEEADFTFIRDEVGASDGNLNNHLSKLEENGYIDVNKMFKNRKPLTVYSITEKGLSAFKDYVDHLERLVKDN